MEILKKISNAKILIKNTKLEKLGLNKFSNYKYFTPEQVEKLVSDACENQGLLTKFDLKRNELLELYQASTIYWHATGYRVNEEYEPAKVEHFGISTVEAMAAGNLPIVIAKGGQTEILGKELLLWSWLTQEDCIRHTIKAIRHPELLLRDQQIAQNRAMLFGQKTYLSKMKQLLST